MTDDTKTAQAINPAEPTPEQEPGTPKRRRLLAVVAAVVALALCAGGFAWWSHGRTATAQESCARAARAGSRARRTYAALLDGDARDAAAVKPADLRDAGTLTALQRDARAKAPATASCPAPSNWFDRGGLGAATDALKGGAAWYRTHTRTLRNDVRAVDDSRDARTLADGQALYGSSAGRVADERTRGTLKDALDGRDAKAARTAMAAVNASRTAKAQADQAAAAQAARQQAAAQAQAAQQQAATPAYGGGYGAPAHRGGGYTGGGQPYQAPAPAPAPQAPAQPAPPTPGNSGGSGGQTWQQWMAAHAGPSPCKPGGACGIG